MDPRSSLVAIRRSLSKGAYQGYGSPQKLPPRSRATGQLVPNSHASTRVANQIYSFDPQQSRPIAMHSIPESVGVKGTPCTIDKRADSVLVDFACYFFTQFHSPAWCPDRLFQTKAACLEDLRFIDLALNPLYNLAMGIERATTPSI